MTRGVDMVDIGVVAIVMAFFVVTMGLVAACDHVLGRDEALGRGEE